MSQYDDDAGALAEHVYPCDDPYCQICLEEEAELSSGYDPKDDYRK